MEQEEIYLERKREKGKGGGKRRSGEMPRRAKVLSEETPSTRKSRYREREFLVKRNSVNVKSATETTEIVHSSGYTDFPGTLENSPRNAAASPSPLSFSLFLCFVFSSRKRNRTRAEKDDSFGDCSNS